jgi:hypothetical protein
VYKGLLEYGLKFGENCLPLTKTVKKNGGGKFFLSGFFTSKKFIIFILFLVSICLKFKVKKEKVEKFFFAL